MNSALRLFGPIVALAFGVVGAALLIATGPEVESRTPEPTIPLVRVVTAESGSFSHRVITHGTVQPRTESELVPEVSGRIEWLAPSFASGGFFAKDDPLLRIEAGDYRIAVKRARANLARTESETARATKELGRQQRLAPRPPIVAGRPVKPIPRHMPGGEATEVHFHREIPAHAVAPVFRLRLAD